MHLMGIARSAMELSQDRNEHSRKLSLMIAELLDTINNQQSQELKEIK